LFDVHASLADGGGGGGGLGSSRGGGRLPLGSSVRGFGGGDAEFEM